MILDQDASAFGRSVSESDFLLCNPDGRPVHGHSNMALTLSLYTHRTTGKDRTAAESFANYLFRRAPDPPPNAGTDDPPATHPATESDQG
jgi:hypothetical protein